MALAIVLIQIYICQLKNIRAGDFGLKSPHSGVELVTHNIMLSLKNTGMLSALLLHIREAREISVDTIPHVVRNVVVAYQFMNFLTTTSYLKLLLLAHILVSVIFL
jgi:hypothetical protein